MPHPTTVALAIAALWGLTTDVVRAQSQSPATPPAGAAEPGRTAQVSLRYDF